MNKVYNNIYELRKAKGLSQMDLADKLNINQDSVSKLERGKIQLTIERLELLAEIFGMTVFEIMQYGGETVQQPQIVDNEKVKELENKVLLLEKDLEIRDLKLANIEKIKNDLLFDIMINYIEYMQLSYFIDIFSIQEKEKIEKELNTKFPKEFFIEETLNIDNCLILSSFSDDNEYIQTEMKDFNTLISELEIKKYCSFFYENFKMVFDFKKNLENINEFKNGGNMRMSMGSENWEIVRRNKNDKDFFELK